MWWKIREDKMKDAIEVDKYKYEVWKRRCDEDEIEDTSSPSTHYQHLISPLGWCISHKH